MIKRDKRLLTLNQTIAYKNPELEFVDFSDNLLDIAGYKNEDKILGKRGIEDLPWSTFGEDYESHDRDTLAGSSYGVLTPFHGKNSEEIKIVACTRAKCVLPNGELGLFISVLPILDRNVTELIEKLHAAYPATRSGSYSIDHNPSQIYLTEREQECLFYILRGKTSKVIARALKISHRTVEFHIANLKDKFNCGNKSELISKAMALNYMSVIPKGILAVNKTAGVPELLLED